MVFSFLLYTYLRLGVFAVYTLVLCLKTTDVGFDRTNFNIRILDSVDIDIDVNSSARFRLSR